MSSTNSSGSYGFVNVGVSTIGTDMSTWDIPEQFLAQAKKSVALLVSTAAEGTYSAQSFLFDVEAGSSLTTLVVAVTKISSPTDARLPIAVAYVTVNTNASLKQLYTHYTVRQCHRCPKCLWYKKCCCHNEPRSSPRGHTMAELQAVKQKMTADQFVWFNQQKLPSSISKVLIRRAQFNDNQSTSLAKAIKNYLMNKTAKAEVLGSYNDSVVTAIQTNLTSLKLSSQVLKLNKIQNNNLPIILAALADDHGFDNIYADSPYSQQLQTPQFSYENLFTTEVDTDHSQIIKYIWILGQSTDNSTHTIHFLAMNITSNIFSQALLLNNSKMTVPNIPVHDVQSLNIVRMSILTDNGEFLNERMLAMIAPWQQTTTRIVLNILRFASASVLIPQNLLMLSYFDPEVILPETFRQSIGQRKAQNMTDKIQSLASSVSLVMGTIKDVIQVLKSSSSVTIERIIRFGFNYFNQKSTVLKVIGIPSERTDEFVKAVIMDYNLPSKGSFMLGLTYSDDFAWEQIQYLYSPSMNGTYRSVTLFKNGDSIDNTASFFIVDIDAGWELAPDLLLITKSKSILGGLFSSSKQSIQEVPHALTIDEAVKLQQFFMLVAIGNMGSTLDLNMTIH